MRRGMDPAWLVVDDKVIGISLGADFTAEHEWGIQKIKRALGIDGYVPDFSREKPKYTKPHGIERRTISKHDLVQFYEHGETALLICEDSYWFKNFHEAIAKDGIAKAFKDRLPHDLDTRKLSTAWDGESFGICAQGDEVSKLKELYEAFLENKVAIWIGGRIAAFENGGLILCMTNKVPIDKMAMLRNADLESEKLAAASDATGIILRLDAAQKGYHACSPRWKSGDSEKKTKYEVVYWLNPMQQDENNFGWYSVEELDAWIAGKGPVPMKKDKVRK